MIWAPACARLFTGCLRRSPIDPCNATIRVESDAWSDTDLTPGNEAEKHEQAFDQLAHVLPAYWSGLRDGVNDEREIRQRVGVGPGKPEPPAGQGERKLRLAALIGARQRYIRERPCNMQDQSGDRTDVTRFEMVDEDGEIFNPYRCIVRSTRDSRPSRRLK